MAHGEGTSLLLHAGFWRADSKPDYNALRRPIWASVMSLSLYCTLLRWSAANTGTAARKGGICVGHEALGTIGLCTGTNFVKLHFMGDLNL